MTIIKKTIFVLGCIYLISCNNLSNEKIVKNNPIDFLDSVSIQELENLKGVSIRVRNHGELVDRFFVTFDSITYHLPVFDSIKTKEKIMNSEWYDVVKFAKKNSVDSIMAFDFVRTYTNKVLSVYIKSGAISAESNLALGDFIIFQFPNKEIIYLFPNAKIIDPSWKDFFYNAKKIRTGWYIYKQKV